MSVYKRITCPHCRKSGELRKGHDKLRKIICYRCECSYDITANNYVYWIDYCFNYKRYREKVGKVVKAVAESVLAKRLTEIAEGRFLDKKKTERVEFSDFMDEFVNTYCKQNHKTLRGGASVCSKKLKQYFDGKYLDEITPFMIEKFKAERMKEVSPATVNRALSFLRCMFNRAIDWDRYHDINPFKKVKLLKENNCRLRYLEKEQIARLLSCCEGNLKVIVTVAVNTGMRQGEIFHLKWQEVDFLHNTIYLYDTKNGQSRPVPMNDTVKNALIGVRKHPESPYIFCYQNGERVRDVRFTWFEALKKAGITDFKFHDLRHTAASHMMMTGKIDLNCVREILGHKSLAMTLRYSHLSQGHKQKAVEALAQHLGDVETPQHETLNTASLSSV